MESIELTGKSVEAIRAEAAARLGVSEDQIEVEVIEEKRGLLGFLGGGELRARATVKDAPAEAGGVEEVEAEEPAPAQPAEEGPREEPRDDELARLANRAEQVSNHILQLMGVSVGAQASEIGDEEVRVDLSGDDIALVIGKHGDTLDALQLLVAIIANRGVDANARVVLDAEEYRERRRRSLEATALSHAAKAKQTDREVVIRDLKAYERRIIHLALRDDPEVETYSEGEGRHRNLVVSPTLTRKPDDQEAGEMNDDETAAEE